jgi:hypothetical protein
MYEEIRGYVLKNDGSQTPITKDILKHPKSDYQVSFIELRNMENFIAGGCSHRSWDSPPYPPTAEKIGILYYNLVLLVSLYCDETFPEVPTQDSCSKLIIELDKYKLIQ